MRSWLTFATVTVALATGATAAAAQTITTYRCKDGSVVPVAFFQGDRRAHLQLDGKALVLPRRLGVGGQRYARAGVTLRIKTNGATIRRGGRTTECQPE